MKIETKELKKHINFIEKQMPKKMKKVEQRYKNNLAFAVKKQMPHTFNSILDIKKKKAVNFLNKAIYVQKAKANTGATVGSLAYDGNRKNYGRYMLQRMYFGEKLKQANKKGIFRKDVYVGTKKLTLNNVRNSEHIPKKAKHLPKKQQFAIGLQMARKNGKKTLFTKNAVFKVKNKEVSFIALIRKSNTIRTKKIDWLEKPIDNTLKNKEKIFFKSMNYEFNKL